MWDSGPMKRVASSGQAFVCVCGFDKPIVQGYLDGCQHRLQILLRLRPCPVRGHRLLFLASNLTPHWSYQLPHAHIVIDSTPHGG